ncbi:hypothetical protein FO519_008953 [Halicephalobus sp. NKZ332]|nr:hypothetical protein FO519_008953 [Halicephalobus sp. NKZ332]
MSSAFSKTLSGVSQVISGAPDTPSGISAVPSEASQRPSEVLKILDPDASIVLLSLRILIGIVSVIGNGILLLIFFKFKTFRNQFSNWLISLLAFSDFVIGIGLLLKAIYSIFEKHVPGEGYNRLTCAIMASPQVLGVTCSQVMYISMAIDRLIAVKMKTQYGIFNLRSKIALIVGSWIGSSFFVFLGLFSTLPPGLSRQCSVGAVAGIPFLYIYVISSLLIALFIFCKFPRLL